MEGLKRYFTELMEYKNRNCMSCYTDRMLKTGDTYYCGDGSAMLCMTINGKDFDFEKEVKR